MARPGRFELPTTGSVDRCSIQLSYGRSDSRAGNKAPFVPSVKRRSAKKEMWERVAACPTSESEAAPGGVDVALPQSLLRMLSTMTAMPEAAAAGWGKRLARGLRKTEKPALNCSKPR